MPRGGGAEAGGGAPLPPEGRRGGKRGRGPRGGGRSGGGTTGRPTKGGPPGGRRPPGPPPAPPRNPSARAAVGVSARLAVSVREAVVTIGPLFMASSLLLRR